MILNTLKEKQDTASNKEFNKSDSEADMKQSPKLISFSIFIIILVLNFFSLKINASTLSQPKSGVWTASVSSGITLIAKEFSGNFTLLENEFQHQPDMAFDIDIGRTAGKHWETVARLSFFNLYGKSDSPLNFSAVGNHSAFKGNLYDLPVHYNTSAVSFSGIIRFYLFEFSGRFNPLFMVKPFVESGAGVNYFTTRLSYRELPEGLSSRVIFQKGVKNKQPFPSILQMFFGFGTKIGNSEKLHFIISCNADIADYDCLDAVHNYNNNERNNTREIILKFSAGLVIPLGSCSNSTGKTSNPDYPWAP